jgi:two-component system cell cycle sensor histidine kinase/response regulator CckA
MPPPPHQLQATILAVDDDRGVLEMIDFALRDAGYRVLLADNGRSAIQVYEDGGSPIDLLVTDVMMPDLTGPVLAERLRSRQPELQVLFISGFHDADLVQRFVTAKGFTLLPKPFSIPALVRVVQLALGLTGR